MIKKVLYKKLHFKSGKAQVDFDLLLAYIVFIVFIAFIIKYVTSLLTPYTNTIDFSIHERNALKVYQNSIPKIFDYDGLYKLCNANASNLNGIEVVYSIKGIKLPAWDELSSLPNKTDGEIRILRKNENIDILTGSNSTEYNLTITLIFPYYSNVFMENSSVESLDSASLEKDAFKNDVITIKSNVKSGDVDEFILKTDSETSPFFIFIGGIYGINHDKVFIGGVNINGSCTSGGAGYKQELYGNALMNINGSNTIVEIIQRTWWLS